MKIDHTALFVSDLEGARDFYESYFSGVAGPLYQNPRTGLRAYFLTLGSGARLELLALPRVSGVCAEQRGWDHVAFRIGSEQAVDTLTGRLRADGYDVVDGPRTSGAGEYVSVVLDPEGNRVELMA